MTIHNEVALDPNGEFSPELDAYDIVLSAGSAATVTATSGCTSMLPRACVTQPVAPQENTTVSFTVAPSSAGPLTGIVTVKVPELLPTTADSSESQGRWLPAQGGAQVNFVILQPTFTLMSNVAAQGTAVVIHGTDLPPQSTAAVNWSSGIAGIHEFVADLPEVWWSIAIDPHDTLGLREITVTSSTFTDAIKSPSLLVVPPPSSPPRFFQR